MRFANRKSKSVLATRRDNKGYLYVAPFALGFIFLVLFPMIQSFIYSFNDLLFDGQVHLNFSGLANYRRALFEDVEYRQLLLSAVRDMAFGSRYTCFQYDSRRIPKQKFPRARGFSDNIFYSRNSLIGNNTRAF